MKFFLNSNNTSYLRNLEEEFGESTNGIRLELNKFEKAGFLSSSKEGNKKIFAANTQHPLFNEINKIILKMTGVEYVVDYIVERIGKLEKVYLVGDMAKGHNTSTIDLVLVGNNLNKLFLLEQIAKAERKIGKRISYAHYTVEEFDLSKIKEKGVNPLLLWSSK